MTRKFKHFKQFHQY